MLARVSTRIEDHGEASAAGGARDPPRVRAPGEAARGRRTSPGIDENEDALVKALAKHVLETGKYTWDNVT